ncbi:MAG: CHAT domain-containing protein [Acidimicrobiales bacterium]
MAALPIIEQAELALRIAREDPEQAAALAGDARVRAAAAGEPAAESIALRALGVAARARRQISIAIEWLETSVEVAEQASQPDLAAEARVSLASALAFSGDTQRALDTLDGATPSERVALIVDSDRVGILTMLGRYDEALGGYESVLTALHDRGDPLLEARALTNRGLLYVYTGRFREAESDLARAEQLATDAGHLTEAAGCCHNRGFAAARKGDLVAALNFFDRAEQQYAQAGVVSGARALDRAEALLASGLVLEAQSVVADALASLRAGGDQSGLAEGLVLLASIHQLAGSYIDAAAAATEAESLFDAQDRPAWAALARVAIGRGRLGANEPSVELADAAAAAGVELERLGLSFQAVEAHAVAGGLCLALGDRTRADCELDRAALGRGSPTAAVRLVAWEATAFRRLSAGNRRGALSALRSGLAVVEAQQASLGATELRAHVSIHADRLARLGLRLVIESGRPRQILAWMERRRANSLRFWPLRPPPDQILAAELAELRAVAHETVSRALAGQDVQQLLRRRAQLERAVRQRAWLSSVKDAGASPSGVAGIEASLGSSPDGVLGTEGALSSSPKGVAGIEALLGPRPDGIAGIEAALGERALVALADSDGALHAIVLVAGRCSYHRLGSSAAVVAELNHLRFAVRRLTYGLSGAGAHMPGPGYLRQAAARLDELLFEPLRTGIGERAVVVVPTGALHACPWGVLGTLVGRPTVIAPSAAAFLRAVKAAAPATGGAVIVAGPGLAAASAETRALRRIYPDALVLRGARAKAAAVLEALGGADVAHVAAHASFRADNGLWSALELADGPLTVYELEALRRPPRLVVLSACQSGLSSMRPGDEVLGMVAALLGLGTKTVIASVLPVEDVSTARFMASFHRNLSNGLEPADALASAQATSSDQAAASSFVCFGAG